MMDGKGIRVGRCNGAGGDAADMAGGDSLPDGILTREDGLAFEIDGVGGVVTL